MFACAARAAPAAPSLREREARKCSFLPATIALGGEMRCSRFVCLAHILIGEPVPTPDQVRGRLSPEYALSFPPTHARTRLRHDHRDARPARCRSAVEA